MVVRPRPDERLPAGRDRPRDRAGRPARDDRPLRADGRPGGDPRPAAGPERPADQGVADRQGAATTRSTPRCTGRGSRCSTRRPARRSTCRRAGTWPASGAATTTPAACTRRRRTRWSAAPSPSRPRSPRTSTTCSTRSGINCIRAFPGRGIRVWGARTLSSDPAWRYLNVRRLFNYLEESILNGTQWVVFEPNDDALWARIRRTITAFLVNEWRKGALFGLTPDEAFYVKCDRRDQPGRGHRRRPGRLRDRRRAREAGRVRRLPPAPSSPAAPAWSPSDHPRTARR